MQRRKLSDEKQRREFSTPQSFLWKRKDRFITVEMRLSAGEHKKFYSRIDTLVNGITVHSGKNGFTVDKFWEFILSATGHKSLNFIINFQLKRKEENPQKLNLLLWKRKDRFILFEIGLSAGEHKRFYSRNDTLVSRITVNSE